MVSHAGVSDRDAGSRCSSRELRLDGPTHNVFHRNILSWPGLFFVKKRHACGSFSRPVPRSHFRCRLYEIIQGRELFSGLQTWTHFVNLGTGCFLFSGGASRSSCGASGRSSMWFLGAPGTSSGAAVWGLNGGNEIALPGAGCRGEGIRVSGFLGIPKMELMSRSRGCFD